MSRTVRALLNALLGLFALGTVAGCGGGRPYVDADPVNARVLARIKAGGTLSSASGSVDVYRVNRACQAEYLGSKRLGSDATDLGLSIGKRSYLIVHFNESGFLGSSHRSNAMAAMFTPRNRARYVIQASYDGTFQDVRVFELRGKSRKELEYRNIRDCRPG